MKAKIVATLNSMTIEGVATVCSVFSTIALVMLSITKASQGDWSYLFVITLYMQYYFDKKSGDLK